MINLARLKERVEKATAGPWVVTAGGDVSTENEVLINSPAPERYRRQIMDLPLNDEGRANREFIAHARTDIPKLIEAIEILSAAMSGMYIDECGYGMKLEHVDFETAIGWHQANNEKITSALELAAKNLESVK